LVVLGAVVHEGGACGADHHVAVLVAPDVAEGDDRLAGTGGGGADAEHGGLAVERVAVVQRVGEGDLPEAEVRHQGALGDLRDGGADHGGQGEHRVHQALPELGGLAPGGIEVQGLRVHRHGGELDVVRLAEGAAGAVLVGGADLQLVGVQTPLHDAGPLGAGVGFGHRRDSCSSVGSGAEADGSAPDSSATDGAPADGTAAGGSGSSGSTWATSSPRATRCPAATCSCTVPSPGAWRVCSIFIASTTSTGSPARTLSPSATSTVVTVPGMGDSSVGADCRPVALWRRRCRLSSRSSPGRPIHTVSCVQWCVSGRRRPSTVTAPGCRASSSSSSPSRA